MDRNLLFRELSGLQIYPGLTLRRPSWERESPDYEFDVSLGDSFTMAVDLGTSPKVTGVFIPKNFQNTAGVDAIVYFHGDVGGEKPAPSIDTKSFKKNGADIYWNHPVFPLREQLASSKKSAILIVPAFAGESVGNLDSKKSKNGFEIFMDDCLSEMIKQKKLPAEAKYRTIILAAHSRGGNRMAHALISTGKYGANILECWGFDSLFNSGDKSILKKWLRVSPNHVFYHHSTNYSSYPKKNASDLVEEMKNGNAMNEHEEIKGEGKLAHYKVVANHFEKRIKGCSLLKDASILKSSLTNPGSSAKSGLAKWLVPLTWPANRDALRDWHTKHKSNKKFHPDEPADNIDQFPIPPWIDKNEVFKRFEDTVRTNPKSNEATVIIGDRHELVSAQYFVIHDTAVYADISESKAKKKDNIHLWLNVNSCYLTNDWAKAGVGTKIEIGKRNRCFVHTEITRHPKRLAAIPDIKDDRTLYTYRQYKLLAIAYIVASLRKGRFLTVTIHREVDRGIVKRWTENGVKKVSYGHNDPQYFDIEYFYNLVNLMLGLYGYGFTYGIPKERVLANKTKNLDGDKNEFIPYILGEVESANQYGPIKKSTKSEQAPPGKFARECAGKK